MTSIEITINEQQLERINAIAMNDISGLETAMFPPASIDTHLPVLIPLEVDFVPTRTSSSTFNITFTWDLHLYIAALGTGLETVNGVNIRTYLSKFANAFMKRRLLQLNDNGLAYVTDSEFRLVSGLSKAKAYPPNSGGRPTHWGCQYRLTITIENYVIQSA